MTRRDPATLVLAALLLFAALVAVATPLAPTLIRASLRAHQLRPSSAAEWLALQPLPKMYSCAHRAWYAGAPDAVWVNHYPARLARFDGARALVAARGAPRLTLRSSYRGVTLATTLDVRLDGHVLRLTEP